MSSSSSLRDMDITRDELERVTNALKNDEFKKLFFDYVEELQDPENRKRYEEEITQLEAERGVQIQFLNPEAGFVVKTSMDGKTKAFINIAKCDKVDRPKSERLLNPETGKPGLRWNIPLAQAPPRKDIDNSGRECVVYDVMFHPEALHLAEKDRAFRNHLVDTACDAIEREFKVKLDRTNLKFPKLKFKGIARAVVVRKMSNDPPPDLEPSPLDKIYPPLPKKENSEPKVYSGVMKEVDKYATPKYVIKHRRGVDMSEMTYEIDAKLNLTIPRELVVEVELPLLKSTSNCNLDVTERQLYLVCESPAKYKLCLDLPYPVNDKEGSAKFDQDARKLIIVLPVCAKDKERKLKDLYREDSGVESDVKEESGCISPDHVIRPPLVEIIDSVETKDTDEDSELARTEVIDTEIKFLKDSIKYNFPPNFDCNTLDENLAFTLHVKNVDPQSVETISGEKFVHLKFTSIGSGYYPTHYAFYVILPEDSEASITSFEAEPWDNNVILTLALKNYENLKSYFAGLDEGDLKEHPISEQFRAPSKKFSLLQEKEELEISVERSEDQVQIDIKPTKNVAAREEQDDDDEKVKENKKPSGGKKPKKKNKKRRSLSESSCDEFKSSDELAASKQQDLAKSVDSDDFSPSRKVRSSSESRENDSAPVFKGILKHRSRYGRSISESWSSIDELPFSCSVDLPLSDSIGDIPEEDGPHPQELSESCKKTVRFSDVIRKQLFRLDSSILGQRKKNQKRRNQKQRALQRRNSEGDSPEYFDKVKRPPTLSQLKNKKSLQHDSGLDLSENIEKKDNKKPFPRGRLDSESSDLEGKNSLMFDMEM